MNKQLSKAALTALLLLVPMECNAATALEEPGVNLPAAKRRSCNRQRGNC